MKIDIKGTTYIIVDMLMWGKGEHKKFKYNVFTENYKHIFTCDADNYNQFYVKFLKHLDLYGENILQNFD